jgi:uncharacterized SAM-binding protein YcdF (DUF218 family)
MKGVMRNVSTRRRRWIFGVALLTLLFMVFAADAGRLLIVDEPQRSDVILVLAGETDHRTARALELLDQGYGRRVVIDVPAAAKIYGFTEVQLAEKYVQSLPQSAAVTVCPIDGLSTWDESRDAERCLGREEGDRVLIVTSDFHTRRALSVFRREVPGKKFAIAASHDGAQFGTRWWMHRQWAKTCLDEWLRLVWWTVVDRWR